jgi:signal transduction histidine kinase
LATKLKKFNLYQVINSFLIVIFLLSTTLFVFENTKLLIKNKTLELVLEDTYFESFEFRNSFNKYFYDVYNFTENTFTRDEILSGEYLEESSEYAFRMDDLFEQYKMGYLENGSNYIRYDENLSYEENHQNFTEQHKQEIEDLRNGMIENELIIYDESYKYASSEDIIYSIEKNNGTFTHNFKNISDLRDKQFYLIIKGRETIFYPEYEKTGLMNDYGSYFWNYGSQLSEIYTNQDTVYFAFTDEYINEQIAEWNENKQLVENYINTVIPSLILMGLSSIILLFTLGRRSGVKGIHLNKLDKLYTDFNLIMIFTLVGLWFGVVSYFMNAYVLENDTTAMYFTTVTMVLFIPAYILVLSLIKNIKNGTIIRHSLTFIVMRFLFHLIKTMFFATRFSNRIIFTLIAYSLLLSISVLIIPEAAFIFGLIPLTFAVWYVRRGVTKFEAIRDGVNEMVEGNIHYQIQLKDNDAFGELAHNINQISDGLAKAVDNEVQSERLKSELITNVSHDIRTPLTSIITYVDLIKNDKDNTDKYVDVIEQKSQKLKRLIDDLFEATKASSGAIVANFEQINIRGLLEQALAEFDEQFESKGLAVRISSDDCKDCNVAADGRLMWRVIENLLVNITKYALPQSRVYIDLKNVGNEIHMSFKNISEHELNVPASELMERFKQGDESRQSDGSGLGLSIAGSLMEIQKGHLDIEIDGDLFKATIKINK